MTLGERIRFFRKAKGLSQRRLSHMCYCSESIIGYYENDKIIPSVNTMDLIAEALGITVEELAKAPIPSVEEKPQTVPKKLGGRAPKIVDPEMKSLKVAIEVFERMDDSEKICIQNAYAILGTEVVRQQVRDYKGLYSDYLTAKSTERKAGLRASLDALRRWFINELHHFVVIEMSGEELVEKIESDVRKGFSKVRKLKTKEFET